MTFDRINNKELGSALRAKLNAQVDFLNLVQPVITTVNTPPSNPSEGDRYIIGLAPTGVFQNHENQIAEFSNSQWSINEVVTAIVIKTQDGRVSYLDSGQETWIDIFVADQSSIIEKRIPLTTAQIKTLSSAPVQIDVAPGVGYAWEVIKCSLDYDFVSVVFPINSIEVYAETTPSSQQQFSINSVIDQGADKWARGVNNQGLIIENKALFVRGDVDAETGNGSAVLHVTYNKVTR